MALSYQYGKPVPPKRLTNTSTRLTSTGGRRPPAPKGGMAGPNTGSPFTPGAAATNPLNTPQPADPTLEARRNQLNTAYNDTNLAIGYDEGRVKQDYGFDDLSNPFSRARLLETTYKNQQSYTRNSLASQGQLNSGFALSRQGRDTRNYDINTDNLRRSYQDQLQSIINRRTGAKRALDEGNLEALDASTQRSLDQRPDPATVPEVAANAEQAAPKPLSSKAAARRKKRQQAGITDVRGLSAAQIKKLRSKGLLPG